MSEEKWEKMKAKLSSSDTKWKTAGPLLVDALEKVRSFSVALGEFRLYGTGPEGEAAARQWLEAHGGKWFDPKVEFLGMAHVDRLAHWNKYGLDKERIGKMKKHNFTRHAAVPKVRWTPPAFLRSLRPRHIPALTD